MQFLITDILIWKNITISIEITIIRSCPLFLNFKECFLEVTHTNPDLKGKSLVEDDIDKQDQSWNRNKIFKLLALLEEEVSLLSHEIDIS